jgi:CBS domain-containing protein
MATLAIDRMTAADLMQRDVVTISRSETLRDALALMTENHVTGLPAMDEHSRCVGVVTATDILNFEQDHSEESTEANDDVARFFNPDNQQWESIRFSAFALEEFGEVRIDEVMSSDLITVERSTPIKEVAERMIDEDVHRILVLDDEKRLYGIISAIDFVRLFAEK